MYTHNLMMAL